MAARLERLFPAVLLALLVVVFHWKLTLTNQYTWLESPDVANLVMPWLQFQAGEWHMGRFPLWDPYAWAGQPLVGQAQPGAVYPLNWLLFLAPLKHGWIRQSALHIYYVLIRVLAAWTMYWFCRDLKRSRAASIAAGLIFSLGGYVACTDWPQMVNGAVWAPVVFLYLFRAARGEQPMRSAILSGFFLGVTWLAGHHQMQLYLSIAVGALWLYYILRDGRPNWPVLRCAVASGVLLISTSAVQTIPTAEYGQTARRWSGTEEPLRWEEKVPYTVHEEYALNPNAMLGIVLPGFSRTTDPFIGGVAFALALLGLAVAWDDLRTRWLAAVAFCGIFFALGPHSLLHGVLYALMPMVEKARVPAAGILLFSTGIAPLAAWGFDAMLSNESPLWSRRMMRGAAIASAIGFLICLGFHAADKATGIPNERLMMTSLYAALFAGLLFAARHQRLSVASLSVCLLCLIMFELANETDFWLPHNRDKSRATYLKPLTQHSDIVDYLREQPMPRRVAYDGTLIPFNLGDWYGVEVMEDYKASVSGNVWQNDLWNERVRGLLGVAYWIGDKPQLAGQEEVFKSESGLKVYRSRYVLPRTWAVHQAVTVKGEGASRGTLIDPAFNPLEKVFVATASPPLEQCDTTQERVMMTRHEPNHVTIEATLSCRGMVILSDTYFAGWKAEVDGRSVPIAEAYNFLRGVVTERGKHVIEMRYRPGSVALGALLSVSASIIALLTAFRRR